MCHNKVSISAERGKRRLILKDTLGDAIILSVFDFLMGFVVLFCIGLLIRGLKYIEIIDRGKAEPDVKVRSSKHTNGEEKPAPAIKASSVKEV